ncbi:UDP-N-acetylmuramoyl-L-alanyl-D-glutamate--2,6-diaminopimelate ligase [Pseudomarimonas salicorniae]|uniref:UDP-N-acetylmuramoyl-L-alanyl-D-glutamate--2,6-diaminopimelate ligase n=1 Tax=Pseudomarimonas salicorniae TaxID=2933270 RepID=A0ABT0GHF0_9GAMM|nr:UDP-N-acetylmuramoyl-L-alanyl-D-glutamate--2,6-diaminopimelate ligase [Lysobacter sp. CAU 1642]MCK7593963.1 UDP-N-acetylmuramoyl-L-alanyl-D-glutamate--2,6-diaminopimelate ligase [Lysobacter sp. CAU 1642]
MSLATLLDGIVDAPAALASGEVGELVIDSREAGRGDVFVALPGSRRHGIEFLPTVRAAGVLAVLVEPEGAGELPAADDLIVVAGLRARLGELARRRYGDASARLRLLGVTGTNGKTSCVQLLAQALSGTPDFAPCGHIGTLGVGLADWRLEGERTTPDVLSVHRLLADLEQRGARSAAMEVSSHALDQGRVDGIRFDVAAFSNLTRDHLDYHGSMEAYGAAKARLFAHPGLRAAVINLDDGFGRELAGGLDPALDAWTVSAAGNPAARLRAEQVRCAADGLHFDLVEGAQRFALHAALVGRFNVDNLMLVAGCLRALGRPLAEVASSLGRLAPVRGRMQRIEAAPGQPLVVVDYAHTPDALQQALASLRSHVTGRLICVFGCGGERDPGKRPLMAAIAEQGADLVVVTDDNPRGEDGDAIVAAILEGFERPQAVRIERDRAAAIALALDGAGADDAVLIAGKGHEAYQESAGRKRPFDDAATAASWLEARAA